MWAVVAEITKLKAGGAFVPLDPAQRAARLEDIVHQTNATLAISSSSHVDALSSLVSDVIPMSETSDLLMAPMGTLTPVIHDRTGYVLFTSGSTGRPKRCVVSYRALSDVVHQTPALHIMPESRVLQFASYTYGMSLIEIHCALSVGATIFVPPNHERLNELNGVI